MCGIAGIINRNQSPVEISSLLRMADTIRHRGPDDSGTFAGQGFGSSPLHIGLAHRRLSIIDLSALGRQPMANEDKSVFITFNGEIYNYAALRKDLVVAGHQFTSQTDTEVLVHGYEEYGVGIFDRISGMFALAIADLNRNEVILARDPYGKKPLYYYESANTVVFGSEAKAILAKGEVPGALDVMSMVRYLSFEYVPAPYSIFKHIQKLPAGSYMRITAQGSTITKYWDVGFSCRDTSVDYENEEAVALHLVTLLRSSIVKRLMADVPVGVFLSGGIDSSACVALLAGEMDTRNIKTFSIGFEDATFDESQFANLVATQYGTQHHHKIFTASQMLDMLPFVQNILDEPFADASVLPTALLCQFTRQNVTVAIGGDGGDELFAGYDPFIAHAIANKLAWMPRSLKSLLSACAGLLPVSHANMSLDFKIKQFLKGLTYPMAIRNQVWLGAFPAHTLSQIVSPEVLAHTQKNNVYEDLSTRAPSERDWVDSLVYQYCRHYLAEDILTKVDRASMAFSLEVRTPFLDKDLSNFVHSLPSHYKLRGLTRKYILKKSLRKLLPDSILYRKKKGFGIPLSSWIRTSLRPELEETLSSTNIAKAGLFNPKTIRRLLDEHYAGTHDNRKQIWTLFMFERWRQRFCASASVG